VARDWDDGGKRKEDEQPALHHVGGPFEDLSTLRNCLGGHMEIVVTTSSPSSLRCSSKNEAANFNASIQQQ
jgi:hypothetical protein